MLRLLLLAALAPLAAEGVSAPRFTRSVFISKPAMTSTQTVGEAAAAASSNAANGRKKAQTNSKNSVTITEKAAAYVGGPQPSVTGNRGADSQYWMLERMQHIPLLKAGEEKILGGRIQRRKQLLEMKEAAPHNFASAEELEAWAAAAALTVEQLTEALREGDEAKMELVSRNMRLVVAVARRYQNLGVSLTDLVQEGSLGLIKAADRFDPWRGFRFSTYASWWIQQTVTRAVAGQSRVIRLPMHVHNLLNKVRRLRREMVNRHGDEPTEEELAQELDMPVARLRTVLRASSAAQVVCLKDPLTGADFDAGVPIDSCEVPETVHNAKHANQQVLNLLTELGENEAKMVILRYGLFDGQVRSPTKIAQGLGIPRTEVARLLAKALRKLRQPAALHEVQSIVKGTKSSYDRKVPGRHEKGWEDDAEAIAEQERWAAAVAFDPYLMPQDEDEDESKSYDGYEHYQRVSADLQSAQALRRLNLRAAARRRSVIRSKSQSISGGRSAKQLSAIKEASAAAEAAAAAKAAAKAADADAKAKGCAEESAVAAALDEVRGAAPADLALASHCEVPVDIKAQELGIDVKDWQIVEGVDALAALAAEDAFHVEPALSMPKKSVA
uniref:RNA polymerase sigma-70 domain-containing protein n=1 Tax=Phaeomonas parva TaxID=124430 RepID=A0A6U4JI23_9STRA|mmetsp:Transcript_41584/g.130239  ORF Transcript_41584/g.130239 Transcript_41584/m.130239 type:complete len:614 (+) Transcript_41584:348-2189(+)|eukprot:CAMPEP_0118858556 /NCGR_PEP_ID=MMETSP1163-20130328/5178_1 /TAXON_ID=124430 /ORGANISM="Phaeomonas parva, Strain CCMP2877" /LENGTH=613 /DNA_ID=CAMNT_0006792021 /DNA_START=339 /DNA_END=2180 /DNA_ORIENTATION=+